MVDFDKSGMIKYDEFIAATVDIGKFCTKEKLEAVLKMFDFDNDNFIKPEDICRSFTSIGEEITLEQASAMITKYDSDNNFLLDLDEFKQMLLYNPETPKLIKNAFSSRIDNKIKVTD